MVAWVVNDTLSDGDKENQLLQGLLNQRAEVKEAKAEGRLFSGDAFCETIAEAC